MREEARPRRSVGGDVIPSFGATIGMTKKIEEKWGLGLRWPKL
jgi:hypothetical protein